MHPSPSPSESPPLRSEAAFSDFTSNVREAEVDFLVTDQGRKTWSARQCPVGASVLQFAVVGASVIADGVTPQADKLLFVLQSSSAPHRVYLNGERIAKHGIAVLPPGSDFVFANQVPHKWISFTVGLDRLPPRVIDRFDEQIELHVAALLAAEEARFAKLVRLALNASLSRSPIESAPSFRCPTNVEGELIGALTATVASSGPYGFNRERGDGRHYHAIVRNTLAGIPDKVIVHVDDLCRLIGIKERTLQRSFSEIFRMPPKRYLQLRQLNQVHAALCAAEAQGQLVMDILMRHGITELGRFAAEYRALFGELPSQTIRHRQKLIG